jgi:hypothetical protein
MEGLLILLALILAAIYLMRQNSLCCAIFLIMAYIK